MLSQWVAWISGCDGGWTELCWSKWDSGLYLDIVAKGHTLFPCEDNAANWCGNAGWAPLYPLLISMLGVLGLNPGMGGLVLSQVFYFGLLMVSARLWEVKDYSLRSWLAIGITAFAPGAIYFQSLFPVATVVFFMALVHLFIIREQWLKAGMAAFFAVLSYSSGQLLLASFAFYGLFLLITTKRIPWNFVFQTVLPAVLGLLVWFLYDYVVTGSWNAMFLIQQKYGHGLQSPIRHFGEHMKRLFEQPFALKSWVEIQNLLIMIYVIGILVLMLQSRLKGNRIFQGFFLLVFWLLPYSISMDVSLYRGCALLAPSLAIHRNSKLSFLLILFFVSLVLYIPLGILFVKGLII